MSGTGESRGKNEGGKPASSIREVAAAAGVSIATVSRVMNNPAAVSPATAARVLEVIRRLEYSPSPLAQAFSSGESRVIGLALPAYHGEFFTELLHGADAEAARLGYHLLVTTVAPNQSGGARRQRMLGAGLVDGLAILIASESDPFTKEAVESPLPTVVIDTDMRERELDSVILDNEKGTREAVEHLLRWVEPSRLHFVGGPMHNFDASQRLRTFTQVLSEHGWRVTPDQISSGEYTFEWGKEWALRTLRTGNLQGAGVLAGDDTIACGIIRAAEDAHVWVPDQLRIVGFDDSRIASIIRPRLSSVALPMVEVGAAAINMLTKRMEHRDAPVQFLKLPTRLIVRESSTAMSF